MYYYHINTDTLTIISGPHTVRSTYLKNLTASGNPECLNLASYGIVPQVFATLGINQKYGDPVVYVDRVEMPAVAKSAEELAIEAEAVAIAAELAAQKQASPLDGVTFAQVDTYIDANVTDLASAKAVMKKLAKAILLLNKTVGL